MERKHYLDNIRFFTVLLVVVYHVFYLFNAAGVPGGLPAFSPVQYQDAILYFVYPWFMVLLFLVAGISAKLSLNKRGGKAFLRSRTVKLLIPSTLGLFVFQWMVGWMNITISGGWAYMNGVPGPVKYLIAVLSGVGPLWFAQTLWLYSLITPAMAKLKKLDALGAKCPFPVVLAFFLLIWGGAQVLNLPVLTTYRFGIYFVAYALGFFVFSHEEVMERLDRFCVPLVVAALAMGLVFTLYWFGKDYASDACLKNIFTNLYLWTAVLAVLAAFRRWFHKTGRLASYLTRASYSIYVLHYAVLLGIALLLKDCGPFVCYALMLLGGFTVPVALYELLRRIPVLRRVILGI